MYFLTRNSIEKCSEWLSEAVTSGAAVLIDKDKNWTSFDVIAKLRRLTGIRKIGHTGTLDPLATGLLIVCAGKATKEIDKFKYDFKTYQATIKIGVTTKSYDGETEEIILGSDNWESVNSSPGGTFTKIEDLSDEIITKIILSFKGFSAQEPPLYSAKKIKGVPAYKLARKDKQIKLEPKQIEISEIQIKSIEIPFISFKIVCSAGTYIRALARDIGIKLGCGAYLYELRRTAIGNYQLEDALTIDELKYKFEDLRK
ncbi:MAG: tRNA pseudouridine(55) synthase TruB [Bacteroidetes bacterium]|nr:MAG: tRNA pseudouridine(55) synthase TruB [Bacteroidota bacterium]